MNRAKQKVLVIMGLLTLAIGTVGLVPAVAGAAPAPVEGGGGTSIPTCGSPGDKCDNFIDKYINPFIVLLSGLVGVAAVISIIVAGIQYSSSADDPATVSKAKQRIFNTIIGLVAYIFLFAFLNYLIPGGIL